jgi:hypothetical protein
VAALDAAIKKQRGRVIKGRPADQERGAVCSMLNDIFTRHRAKSKPVGEPKRCPHDAQVVLESRRNFLDIALTRAGIPHPDPSETKRFDELLIPSS